MCSSDLMPAQDTTETGGAGGIFSLGNLFDLVDLLIAWLLGIVVTSSGFRKILDLLAVVLPFLRGLANRADKNAVLDIAKRREARMISAGQNPDIKITTVDPQ